jgi:hypothetical protein
MLILLMNTKTVFQLAINSFRFPQNTPESINNKHPAFLRTAHGLLLQTCLSHSTKISFVIQPFSLFLSVMKSLSFRRFCLFRKISSTSFLPSARTQGITVTNLSCLVVLTTSFILLHVLQCWLLYKKNQGFTHTTHLL